MSAPFADYLDEVERACIKNPAWRYGQAAFNVLHEVNPALANQIRGTHLDPFHRSETDVCPAFWQTVAEGLS